MNTPLLVHTRLLNQENQHSLIGKARIDKGIEFLKTSQSNHIIFVAGIGKQVEMDPDGAEYKLDKIALEYASKQAAIYANSKGIPFSHMSLDYRALDTVGEAYIGGQLIRQMNKQDAIVVSSNWHLPRVAHIHKHINPDLHIRYESSHIPYELAHLDELVVPDMKKIDIFDDMFGTVQPGDLEKIEHILCTEHELYKYLDEKEKPKI